MTALSHPILSAVLWPAAGRTAGWQRAVLLALAGFVVSPDGWRSVAGIAAWRTLGHPRGGAR